MASKIFSDFSDDEKEIISQYDKIVINSGLTKILPYITDYKRIELLSNRNDVKSYHLKFINNKYKIKTIFFPTEPSVNVGITVSGNHLPGTELWKKIKSFAGKTNEASSYIKFYDVKKEEIPKFLSNLIDILENIDNESLPVSRSSSEGFEGLDLPAFETENEYELGQTFTWKEVLSILQEKNSIMFKSLNRPGIYLQRSKDGKARYIGSAYGDGGIIGRWATHLTKGGDAKFLGWYILENGYKSIEFTVLEFIHKSSTNEEILNIESKWKKTLSTKSPIYNGIQLNNN